MLNVREASHKQIMDNAEINNIIKILGLQYKLKYVDYDDVRKLRYGKVMIMTDQDQDGSHIKGLLINFIHTNWPNLLKHNFLVEFITPIVKASKNKKEYPFYSLPEFEEWKSNTDNWHTYKIKYYKGLGTSTSKEAKEYFSDMTRHKIPFRYSGADDDTSIQLAFSKKYIEERKTWLTNWMQARKSRHELGLSQDFLYGKDTKRITYSEFVNKELVLFSNLDNERSIPCLVDGLKPGQRKVLFTCLKRNLTKELKVAQLAGSVAEISAYHHGEASLMSTIVNLAQDFVGSNNLNLLEPVGQFGTRLHGGKDSASPRYIFTCLNELTRLLFHQHDDAVLSYLNDDGQSIEPEWYCPILPLVLINGASGIGTGWSTNIPNFDVREVAANVRRLIKHEEPVEMKPSYKGFNGTIEFLENQRYVANGEIAVLGTDSIEITELPVGTWTQSYKESVDYKEYHTDTTVRFVVKMSAEQFSKAEQQGFYSFFKLQSIINLSNMVLFDDCGILKQYESSHAILKEFYDVRLRMYSARKQYLDGMLEAEARKLSNQARFILEKIEGKIVIENKKKKDLIETLVKEGYDSDPVKAWKVSQSKERVVDGEGEEEESDPRSGTDFAYLLNMPLLNLTREKKEELLKQRDDKRQELDLLRSKTPSNLWEEDLDAFMAALEKYEAEAKKSAQKSEEANLTKQNKGGRFKSLKSDLFPSKYGQRVEPPLPKDKMRSNKTTRVKKEKTDPKQNKLDTFGFGGNDGDNDDIQEVTASDAKPKAAAKKLSAEQKPRKSSTVLTDSPSKKPKESKKKNPWETDSDDFDLSVSDLDDSVPLVSRQKVGARKAANVKKYKLSDHSSDDSDGSVDKIKPSSKEEDRDSSSSVGQVTPPKKSAKLSEKQTSPAKEPTSLAKKPTSPAKKTASPAKKTASSAKRVLESDDDIISLSGDDSESNSKKPAAKAPAAKPAARKPAARKPAAKKPDAAAKKRKPAAKKTDDKQPKLNFAKVTSKKSSPDSFTIDSSDDEDAATKKPAASKKPAANKKKPAASKRKKDSDSDSNLSDLQFQPKKKAAASKKAKNDDTLDFSLSDADTPVARRPTTARAKKPVSYFSDSEDSD
ncbi:TOP2A [Bugula neritina]|uniref:DNA topoisomerase (ATP-hydrolyzing) n=1 Tax=Bugula neritina TaxID=10212 RepID=A0A7J7JXT4_BUGNE|nr:TOP2A [Bugula neritina]